MTLKEELAEYSHDISWAGWMRYFFSCCEVSQQEDGTLIVTIPPDKAIRWQRQMRTLYVDLPEKEKQSDLEQAKIIINILQKRLKK